MPIPMHPVNSSNISYIGYVEEDKELFITFRSNNSTYKYVDVSKDVYENLKASSSIGSYFRNHIQSKYAHSKV